MRVVLAVLALANPAAAEPHRLSVTFAERPCFEAVGMIDQPAPNMEGAGMMAMAFGFLLGFEAANGGDLSGDHETVLMNFRAACLADPSRSGLDVINAL